MKSTSVFRLAVVFLTLFLFVAFSGPAFGQGDSKNKGKKAEKSNADKSEKGKSADRSKADDDRGKDDVDGEYGKGKNKDDRDMDGGNGKGQGNGDSNRDRTSRRFNGLAKKIGMSPERARNWYEREVDRNPDLTYGQFVAANMIARKHGERHRRLTAEAILRRMSDGDSLGQAVKSLGLKDKDYKKEKKRIDGEFGDYERDVVEDIVERYSYKIGW